MARWNTSVASARVNFSLQDQRDNQLWMDAGIITTQADWSLDFDVGMNFTEWHGPVPLAHQARVFERALKFLLNLQNGHPVRRLNWTMTINPRLDTSPEHYDKWGTDRTTVTPENVGDKVHLRVELQGLWRLPRSNAILFSIRCYLIKMQELVTVPKWARRFPRVLKSLPPEIVDYKGLTRYRDTTIAWLSQFDDGAADKPRRLARRFPRRTHNPNFRKQSEREAHDGKQVLSSVSPQRSPRRPRLGPVDRLERHAHSAELCERSL